MTIHAWSFIDEYVLRRVYPHYRGEDIAVVMGIPLRKIYAKAKRLGLTKSDEFFNGPLSGRTDGKGGSSTRFRKGNVPWTKGTNHNAGGRSIETRFKKGQRPINEMPIGSYRVNGDGYVEVKFADEPGPYYRRWVPIHRKVWIEAHGPIPPKHMIVFKDNKRTTNPEEIIADRLECIDMAENARRNNMWLNHPEWARLVHIKAQITRRVNKIIKESPCQTSTN